jgi:dienelactone hydrolase
MGVLRSNTTVPVHHRTVAGQPTEENLRTIYRIARMLGLLIAASAASGASPQATSTADLPVRTEIYPIASLTLTDDQFLKGDASGKPVTVAGVLRIAQGSGRLPVVVMMHGSGGMGANEDDWSKDFLQSGISTFAIDGFTGRGIVQTNTDQARLGRLNFIIDIYRSLEILAHHPRVDSARIVLMGFSRGGQAVLYASMKRFHKLWNKSGSEFAAYLPLYPDCMTSYVGDTDLVDRTIHIFQGGPDDYNPIAACKRFMQRVSAAGRTIGLTEYANAQHGFDNPLLPPVIVVKGAQTVRQCEIEERPVGTLLNAQTSRHFGYTDDCVQHDPHVGYDPEATVAAHAEVKALILNLGQ